MTPTLIIPAQARNESAAKRYVHNRFTVDGSQELENHIGAVCDQVYRSVSRIIPPYHLEAMLLAGGYGRGEGGVLRCGDSERPYNDMEFYIFLRGSRRFNEWRLGPQLHELAEELSVDAGIEIEFKILSFRKLRISPASMFYYDLIMGHHWLAGHEGLLAGTEHHREAGDIPLHEATRLLMNRASGLLFARAMLEEAAPANAFGESRSSESADFVARNIAKAKLALGDAVLTVYGRYHWSCRQRNSRLHDLIFEAPHLPTLRAWHDEGLAFKLNPEQSTRSRKFLRDQHEEVTRVARDVFLWVERRRLARNFPDIHAYALSPVNKCPESNWARNVILNVKTFGINVLRGRILRHPRERVLNALTLLLWGDGASDPAAIPCIRRALNIKAATFADFVRAYRCLWRGFN
jgi:hypothetical protein